MSSIRIVFDRRDANRVLVEESGALQEHEQIWVWDVFYASLVHALARQGDADDLRELLDGWAVQMASKVYIPEDKVRTAGLARIRRDLELVDSADALEADGLFVLQVSAAESGWPEVSIAGPDDADGPRLTAAVVALAQHFLDRNPLFIRELPIHVLSLRKFYADVLDPSDPRSVDQAPVFALGKALEYYQDAGEVLRGSGSLN
ncbi:MAG TPA: hypothetical protein VKA14_09780 [Gammaproteobacteria bacterium]|nr:hypothetical protein [Gammaproteobacteria bacterium]